jgi:hypothetical protein
VGKEVRSSYHPRRRHLGDARPLCPGLQADIATSFADWPGLAGRAASFERRPAHSFGPKDEASYRASFRCPEAVFWYAVLAAFDSDVRRWTGAGPSKPRITDGSTRGSSGEDSLKIRQGVIAGQPR